LFSVWCYNNLAQFAARFCQLQKFELRLQDATLIKNKFGVLEGNVRDDNVRNMKSEMQ